MGTKAVNALSERFIIRSYREGTVKSAVFEKGVLVEETPAEATAEKSGTEVIFKPDNDADIFGNFAYQRGICGVDDKKLLLP